jgi:hypothetical protein
VNVLLVLTLAAALSALVIILVPVLVILVVAFVLGRAALELAHPSRRAPHHGLLFLTPIVEGETARLRTELKCIQLDQQNPFKQSDVTHMARFAIIAREEFRERLDPDEPVGLSNDYLLTHLIADARPLSLWDTIWMFIRGKRNAHQYLETLAGIPKMGVLLQKVYGCCVGYRTAATPLEFRQYMSKGRIHAIYTYRDTHRTLFDVRRALDAQKSLRLLASELKPGDRTAAMGAALLKRYKALRGPGVGTSSSLTPRPRR